MAESDARGDDDSPALTRLLRVSYSVTLHLLLPLVLLRLLWLGWKTPGYRQRWRERFGLVRRQRGSEPVLLLHAVSVGEVLAAKPLLHRIQASYPAYRIVVTTTTPTGAMTVRQNFGDSVEHLYFPYDLPLAVATFLDRVAPRVVMVMETEIWPNFFAACRRRGIPLALVNARLSARSAARYARIARLARVTLHASTLIAAQSAADARRFADLGAAPGKVTVCGNLKYDVHLPPSVREQGVALRQAFSSSRAVWIAASTHEGEEQAALDAYADVVRSQPRCLLIIAPRHPERFDRVEQLCRRAGRSTARRTRMQTVPGDRVEVFLLDTLGELAMFYACADVAFVGGSLVRHGGHNLLEPAALGLPLISGPHLYNFTEIAERLAVVGALQTVPDAQQLAAAVSGLLQDANRRHAAGERARQVYLDNQGSADQLLLRLQPLLAR